MYRLDEEKLDSIAIVGMSVRVPGADSLDGFWKMIEQGKEAIHSGQETAQQVERKRNHYFQVDTCIKKKKEFDASFFDISAAEAKLMDPQQRCFLECTWEAMENAGYVPKSYDGIIGLYAGAYADTYLYRNVFPSMAGSDFLDSMEVMMTNEKDHIATRTAYKMNFTGPVVNVQSSCSSSLVAVHLACQGLLDYSCDMAIAGAATIVASEEGGYFYQDTGLLSKDGHVRPFDKEATGTIYSEGIGIVVLKRMEEAIEDKDHIYAIIKGSAINNDGSERMGYTAPSVKGQVQAIRRAQLIAETEPDTISYIETHGTGTPLGDRIELEALHQVFKKTRQAGVCALGSIKANIGHTGPASGVIGLIKTALALENQVLPPSINYVHENDAIDIFESPFYVNTFSQKWETVSGIRRAGVSSFGLGGTNVHLILENAPEMLEHEEKKKVRIFPLSAKSEKALQKLKQAYADYLKVHQEISLQDMAYTLMNGRENFKYRYACVCDSCETLLKALNTEEIETKVTAKTQPLVLLVTDQLLLGDSVIKELYQEESHFQKAYDSVKQATTNFSQADALETKRLCTVYALGKMLINWGIQFYQVIGKGQAGVIAKALKDEISLEEMVRDYLSKDSDTKVWEEEYILQEEFSYIMYQKQEEVLEGYFIFDKKGKADSLYQLLARLWKMGYLKSWSAFQKGKEGEHIPIPSYQFDRQIYWMEPMAIEAKKPEETEDFYYIRTEEQLIGYVEPAGFMEKKIAEIWEKELGIKPVGATDGFFQLGGTSLAAAKVNGLLCEYFDIELPLRDFVESQTIRDLKRLIMTM
ncbi:MAG: hypothetical protein KH020_16340 [Clostridiales bacterium]|nr:hypothetical protein [Clostridiales bacterium]